MPVTYTLISSATVGSGGASTIDFTSIPQTYTDLVLKLSGRTNGSGSVVNLSFNSSTTGFTNRYLQGGGSGSITQGANLTRFSLSINESSETASLFGNGEIYIPNYTGSTNKSYFTDTASDNNATSAYSFLIAGLWSNSAAITSISLSPNSGSFIQYSTAYLYGISNA
jgi:hypothetical protein